MFRTTKRENNRMTRFWRFVNKITIFIFVRLSCVNALDTCEVVTWDHEQHLPSEMPRLDLHSRDRIVLLHKEGYILYPELLNPSGSVGEVDFCKYLTNIGVSGIFVSYVKCAFVSDTINMLYTEIRGEKSENCQCKVQFVRQCIVLNVIMSSHCYRYLSILNILSTWQIPTQTVHPTHHMAQTNAFIVSWHVLYNWIFTIIAVTRTRPVLWWHFVML